MAILGALLGLGTLGFAIYCVIKFYSAIYAKRVGGPGKARAEYGRIKREDPQSPDAQLSEAEFVQAYLGRLESPGKWLGLSLLSIFVLFPVSCAMFIGAS